MVPSVSVTLRCVKKFEKGLFQFKAKATKCEYLWKGSRFIRVSHGPSQTYATFDISGRRVRFVEGVNVHIDNRYIIEEEVKHETADDR